MLQLIFIVECFVHEKLISIFSGLPFCPTLARSWTPPSFTPCTGLTSRTWSWGPSTWPWGQRETASTKRPGSKHGECPNKSYFYYHVHFPASGFISLITTAANFGSESRKFQKVLAHFRISASCDKRWGKLCEKMVLADSTKEEAAPGRVLSFRNLERSGLAITVTPKELA